MRPSAVTHLLIGDLSVEVMRKRVRHLSLRVVAPDGAIRVSLPLRATLDDVRSFVRQRMEWIERHRRRLREHAERAVPTYARGEALSLWGRAHRLVLDETVSARTPTERCALIETWYAARMREAVLPLLTLWERRLDVHVARCTLRAMTSKWGSCTPQRRSIRLNLALVHLAPSALEYVVIHELVHLREAGHGVRFQRLMTEMLPDWRLRRAALRDAPVPAKLAGVPFRRYVVR